MPWLTDKEAVQLAGAKKVKAVRKLRCFGTHTAVNPLPSGIRGAAHAGYRVIAWATSQPKAVEAIHACGICYPNGAMRGFMCQTYNARELATEAVEGAVYVTSSPEDPLVRLK